MILYLQMYLSFVYSQSSSSVASPPFVPSTINISVGSHGYYPPQTSQLYPTQMQSQWSNANPNVYTTGSDSASSLEALLSSIDASKIPHPVPLVSYGNSNLNTAISDDPYADIDDAIINAALNPRERMNLLNIENQIWEFVKSAEIVKLFPPSLFPNSFRRLLVYRYAGIAQVKVRYGLFINAHLAIVWLVVVCLEWRSGLI
jgi:hypothetical protein